MGKRSTIKVINKTWRFRDDNCFLDSIAYLRFDRRPTWRYDSWIFTAYGDSFQYVALTFYAIHVIQTINLWHELKYKERERKSNFTHHANDIDINFYSFVSFLVIDNTDQSFHSINFYYLWFNIDLFINSFIYYIIYNLYNFFVIYKTC